VHPVYCTLHILPPLFRILTSEAIAHFKGVSVMRSTYWNDVVSQADVKILGTDIFKISNNPLTSLAPHLGNIWGTFCERLGNIQGTLH
jgi:hypothetical protein